MIASDMKLGQRMIDTGMDRSQPNGRPTLNVTCYSSTKLPKDSMYGLDLTKKHIERDHL